MTDSRIDDYIAKQDEWKRDHFNKLRKLVHKAVPDIEEAFKWGAPTFEHDGQVAWMFAATDWVHFSFPQGALLDEPVGGWEEAADTASKAKRTLRFRAGQLIDEDLIMGLVRQATANNAAGKRVDFNRPKPGSQQFDLPHEHESWLREAGQLEAYLARPYYQQKGWIQWLEAAKTTTTRSKRQRMMISELKHDQYMPNKEDRFED